MSASDEDPNEDLFLACCDWEAALEEERMQESACSPVLSPQPKSNKFDEAGYLAKQAKWKSKLA